MPQLDDEQRRIGFNGTKLEDVNKTRFFGRLRGAAGLSDDYSLDLAYTPPFEVGGAKPHLFALGIGRPFALSPGWRLGVRAYGQIGTIAADITCSADEVAAGPDPDLNPFLCEEPSSDYGARVSVTTGLGFAPSERWRLSAELFYSWLSVTRPPGASAQNDGFLNGRFLVAYRIR